MNETNNRESIEDDRPLITPDDNQEERVSDSELESSGCMSSPLCHPSYPVHRYYVLVFMCFLGFGRSQTFYLLIESK